MSSNYIITLPDSDLHLQVGTSIAGVSNKVKVKSDSTTLLDISQTSSGTTEINSGAQALKVASTTGANIFIEPSGFFSVNGVGSIYLSGDGTIYHRVSGTTVLTESLAGGTPTLTFAEAATSVTINQTIDASAAGADMTIQAQGGASGFANGKLRLKNPATNTALGGGVYVDVGAPVTFVSDPFVIESNGSRLLTVNQSASSFVTMNVGTSPSYNNLQLNTASLEFTAGTSSLILSSTFSVNASQINFAGNTNLTLTIEDQDATALTAVFDSQSATSLTFGDAITSITISQSIDPAAAGANMTITSQGGASGFANGVLTIGTPVTNTVLGGGVVAQVGASVGGLSDYFEVKSNTTQILAVRNYSGYSEVSTGLGLFLKGVGETILQVGSSNFISLSSTSQSHQADTINWNPINLGAGTFSIGAGFSSITLSQTQDASAAGGNFTIRAQRGFTGFAGGDLIIGAGDGGTTGTNAPGNLRVKLGSPVSNVSGKFRLEDESSNTILDMYQDGSSLTRITAGARSLRIGNLTETEVYIGGSGVTTVTSNANVVQLGGTSVTFAAGTVAWISVITTAKLTQTQAASGAGSALTIEAQQGGAASVGGDLKLLSGKGGTPGTNAAGKIILDLGATTLGASTQLQVKADSTTLLAIYQPSASTTQLESASDMKLVTTSSKNISVEPAGEATINSTGNTNFATVTGITKYKLSSTTYKTVILATVNVTTATTTSVYDYTATDGTIYYVHCTWVWSNDTSNHGATFVRELAAEFIGGTLSQIGTTDNAGTTDKIATGFYGAGSPAVVLDVNTNKIRARVTTANTDTINVNIVMEIIERLQA